MLTLFFAPGTSSFATHIALYEVGAPFEAKKVSLHRKENRDPEYLKINPEGKVPALLIDGRPLTEVAGTLFYLARRYPEANLLPADPEAEAQAVSWMSFIASTIHSANTHGEDHVTKVWGLADQRLGKGLWAAGGEYSIADIHLFRLFWRYLGRVPENARQFSNLVDHYRRVSARPAVRKATEAEAAAGYEPPVVPPKPI